jgi:hypothetical protein
VVEAWVNPVIAIIDDGRSGSDGVTSVAAQTISGTYSGTLKSGETIQLYVNGAIQTATVNAAAHTWTYSGGVGTGGETVSAFVTNGSNYSGFATKSFTVDQSGPLAQYGTSYTGVSESADFYLTFDEALYWDDASTLTFQGNGQTLSFTRTQLGFQNGDSWLDLPAALHQMIPSRTYTLTVPSGLTDSVGNHASGTYSISTIVDATAPQALAAYVTSGADDYGIGEGITIVVRFSEAVWADGSPALSLNVGNTRTAAYQSGNGTTDLVFKYVVGIGDIASGLTLSGTSLAGNVRDLAGNVVAADGVKFSTITRSGGGLIGIAIDGQAPSAPGTPDLAALSDSGYSSTDDITNDTTPTVSGSGADPSALMHLKSGSTVIGTGYADSSGNWTLTASTAVSGAVSLTAVQFDSFGNASAASTALAVTVDDDTPDISGATSGSGAALAITFDETIRFTSGSIEVRDGANTLMRTIAPSDTGWYSVSGAVLTLNSAGLADGTYTVKMTGDAVQDVAGNFTAELVGSNPGQPWYVGVSS